MVREREQLLRRLSAFPPVLRGSLRRHANKCGNPACRCHDPRNPRLHGPYDYLSHRYQNRTQTVFLNDVKLKHARQWLANYRELLQVIYRLSEVNFQLLRYHYDRLEPMK